MKTFGLTLSGGGVRALAHAGMLKALEEHNLRYQWGGFGRSSLCLRENSRGDNRFLQRDSSL